MKRIAIYLLLLFLPFSTYAVHPVLAQTETPPAGPVGEVHGTVINRNTGKVVTEPLDVMLHILDMDFVDKDMKHGKSTSDGAFTFADVPFDANTQFALMATFNGVTYSSETTPANMNTRQVTIDVPVYETTSDLANVQVDQMHVLFDFSSDGLETKELYIVSNTGQRTVKDAYDLGNSKFAALKFPLPEDADYVFIKPDDPDRFVKQTGSFVDTYPVLAGNQSLQIMTSYLVPYSGKRTYTYTAPLNIAQINFLLPDQAGVSLKGSRLTGPKTMSLQDGAAYQVYSYTDLKAGETLSLTLTGASSASRAGNKTNSNNNLIAISTAFLGLAVLGTGVWWWRKTDSPQVGEDEIIIQGDETTLDGLIGEIARLDETYEQKGLSLEEYQYQRQELMRRAKRLL